MVIVTGQRKNQGFATIPVPEWLTGDENRKVGPETSTR